MMRWMALFLLGMSISFLYAQTTVTKRYTTEDGLIADDVRVLLMDSEGVLWIGSRAGLSVRKQERIVIDQEAVQRRFTNITAIVEDQDHGIWVGSYGQGILYKGKTQTLLFNAQTGLQANRITSLFVSNEKLYIGTSEGISIINIPTRQVEAFSSQQILVTPSAVSSFYQINQTLFVTTINHGIFKVEGGKLSPTAYKNEIFASFYDPHKQQVLLGLKFDLEIQNKQSNQVIVKNEIKGLRFFEQVEDKVYGVGSDILTDGGGLYSWDGQQVEKLNKKYNIADDELYSLSYDKKRKFLYVGSKKQGLFQVDLDSPLHFDAQFGSIEALATNGTTSYVFGKIGLYVIQQNEIVQTVDKKMFKSYQLTHKREFEGITTRANNFFEIEHRIPADQIQFYKAVIHQNSLWVSTNIGLFQLSTKGRIEKYLGIHTFQFDFYTNHLVETDPYGGVRVYNDLATFDYEYLDREDGTFVPRDIVDMKEGNGRMFLAGALDGLYVFEHNQFRSLLSEGVFLENRLKFITEGEDNQLYVATDFGDIYCLDISKQQPKVIRKIEQKKIVGQGITFIHYVNHQLLVGTNKGITVLDAKGTFLFNKEQGFEHYHIKSSAVLGNRLLLGTTAGLYTLDLSYFIHKQIDYNLVISSIKINETPLNVKEGQILTTKELKLPYHQNSVFIDFVLLGAKYPEKLKFQYRVKPTEQWLDLEQPSIVLNYLNTGEYQIDIRIYDYDSATEQIESLLYVTITPPFYYSWWFFSLLILGAIGLLLVVIQRMKRRQEIKDKQLRYEKKVAELKVLSVRSQLNTHFIFNVLSSFQYFIIAHKEEEALYYLERFASLIRKTLNLSMVDQVSLKEEMDYLEGYFELENMRLDERVQLKIVVEEQLDIQQINVPPLLLQPFVENSLVHAFPESIENPQLLIKAYQVQGDVVLEVIDNGVGNQQFTPLQPPSHESKGMYLVKERMKMIQAYLDEDLSIESTASGTRVRLVLKKAAR